MMDEVSIILCLLTFAFDGPVDAVVVMLARLE